MTRSDPEYMLTEYLEGEHDDVEILLFTEVSNAKDVLAQVLKGGVQAAVVNAAMIPDIFLILVATSNAVRKQQENSMSTRNVFTEIVYNLSSTRNITKALQTFGISPGTEAILVVIPRPADEQISSVKEAIQGTESETIPETLRQVSDLPLIERVHGISEKEKTCGSLVDAVVTRMACRDIK